MNKDVVRLRHILDAIKDVEFCVKDGERDRKTEMAVERGLEIIGEASKHVSDEIQSRYPDIPWKDMAGMRNILIHEYYRVEEETVWTVVEEKLPALKTWVEAILDELTRK